MCHCLFSVCQAKMILSCALNWTSISSWNGPGSGGGGRGANSRCRCGHVGALAERNGTACAHKGFLSRHCVRPNSHGHLSLTETCQSPVCDFQRGPARHLQPDSKLKGRHRFHCTPSLTLPSCINFTKAAAALDRDQPLTLLPPRWTLKYIMMSTETRQKAILHT